jgi:hypothetical protein
MPAKAKRPRRIPLRIERVYEPDPDRLMQVLLLLLGNDRLLLVPAASTQTRGAA